MKKHYFGLIILSVFLTGCKDSLGDTVIIESISSSYSLPRIHKSINCKAIKNGVSIEYTDNLSDWTGIEFCVKCLSFDEIKKLQELQEENSHHSYY